MCRLEQTRGKRLRSRDFLFRQEQRVEIGGSIGGTRYYQPRLHDAYGNFDEGVQGIGGRSSCLPSTDRCLINFKKQLHAC